jgi:putative hydrolase of the HAD superfamily
MLPFDVILFDVGGVLLSNGWDHSERAQVLERFQLDAAEFESRHQASYCDWDRGTISAEEYMDATVFYQPRGFYPDQFFAAICAQSRLLPNGALGILQELSASNKYLVGALNNEARETNKYRFDCFGLGKLFQVALTSSYLGTRKPEPAIYQQTLDILGRPAERILFIDDRQENVDAAEAFGIKALRFDGAEVLRRDLESLRVL